MKKVKFRGGGTGADVVVLVGDLVNKGPHSAAVVAAARQLGALSVRGNHDDSALEAYRQHAAGQKIKVTARQPSTLNPKPLPSSPGSVCRNGMAHFCGSSDWLAGLCTKNLGTTEF